MSGATWSARMSCYHFTTAATCPASRKSLHLSGVAVGVAVCRCLCVLPKLPTACHLPQLFEFVHADNLQEFVVVGQKVVDGIFCQDAPL